MELIYVYIERSSNGQLYNQEVNFSGEYKIEYKKNKNTPTLTLNRDKDYFNIFQQKDKPLQNIAALVGSNGSGKTSLLLHLLHFNLIPHLENKDDEYKSFDEDRIEKTTGIKIYKDDKQIKVYQNIGKNMDVFFDKKEVKLKYNDDSHEKHLHIYISTGKNSYFYKEKSPIKKRQLEKITPIYITNSNYVENFSYGVNGGITSHLIINTKSISNLNNILKRKNSVIKAKESNVEDGCIAVEKGFQEVQNIFCKTKKENLEGLLQLLYINHVKSNNISSYWNNITSCTITTNSCNLNFEELNKETSIKMKKDYTRATRLYDSFYNTIQTEKKHLTIISLLKINLIIETIFTFQDFLFIEDNLFKGTLSEIINKCFDSIKDYSYGSIFFEFIYFNDAFSSINKLKKIIHNKKYQKKTNLVPEKDISHKHFITINSVNTKEIKALAKYITKEFKKEYSFVLKYIHLEFGLSAGERSTLNIFSWIYSLKLLKKIDTSIIKNTEKNILLLLDEVVLYAHPEWQRNIISTLIENLNILFEGKKVQVLFATHSPLLLSDMPKDNVVYLDKCKVVNRDKQNTFGANIFDLYKENFFLSSAIGEFAKLKINEVLNYIEFFEKKHSRNYPKKITETEIEFIIENIGENVLQNIIKNKWEAVKDGIYDKY